MGFEVMEIGNRPVRPDVWAVLGVTTLILAAVPLLLLYFWYFVLGWAWIGLTVGVKKMKRRCTLW